MMKIVQYRYFNFMLHALVWSIVLFFPYLVSDAGNQYKLGPLPGFYFTFSGVVHMIIFYLNALLLYPKLLNRYYWWLYVISVIGLLLGSYWLKFLLVIWWFPGDLQEIKSHMLFPSLVAFIVSVFYSIAVERINAEKLQKEKEAMQLGMELKFLRSQVSPHFLFNILTNLVSLARKKSDHLESSLLKLSGLMRYMLYETGKKNISLLQEVEYLDSYISLQKLRLEQDVEIAFNRELPTGASNYAIEPMLLIPFVENAFKHGTGYLDGPVIDINLAARDGVLVFEVKNKFDCEENTGNEGSPGIGLSNVRSRLSLLYPGRHDLVIHSDKNLFTIRLTLKLL
ncbi:MAG TPA: histidine kinase [Agriterribacter sp.]|nr:histidine kinase [Agriterribacter sp.]